MPGTRPTGASVAVPSAARLLVGPPALVVNSCTAHRRFQVSNLARVGANRRADAFACARPEASAGGGRQALLLPGNDASVAVEEISVVSLLIHSESAAYKLTSSILLQHSP